MIIKPRKLEGVFEISLESKKDKRGFFMRTYDKKILYNFGIYREWVQENHSRSDEKGIIRGLHFQFPPNTETKLVRVIRGAILDVFVDLRKNSRTFAQWDSVKLSEENKKIVFIPKGFAHGFCTLTDVSEVVYKVDNYYSAQYDSGIIWNDEKLNIDWPIKNPILSDKDSKLQKFSKFNSPFKL